MSQRTWLITGISSGFGRGLTRQLLERGDRPMNERQSVTFTVTL